MYVNGTQASYSIASTRATQLAAWLDVGTPQHDGPNYLELWLSAPRRRPGRGVSHGLQPQSLRMIPTAAVS